MGNRRNRGNRGHSMWDCNCRNSSNSHVAGASNNNNNNNVAGTTNNGNGNNVETIISPTENVENVRTNRRTIRRVHPTHINHVNRNITRIENYYPVTQSTNNENIVKEFNCGSDLKNPCCKPVKKCKRWW